MNRVGALPLSVMRASAAARAGAGARAASEDSGSVKGRCALDGGVKGNRGSEVSQTHHDGSVAVAVGILEQDVKARTSGGAVYADNLGTALDAARKDARTHRSCSWA